jgi:hypothetical protein
MRLKMMEKIIGQLTRKNGTTPSAGALARASSGPNILPSIFLGRSVHDLQLFAKCQVLDVFGFMSFVSWC